MAEGNQESDSSIQGEVVYILGMMGGVDITVVL